MNFDVLLGHRDLIIGIGAVMSEYIIYHAGETLCLAILVIFILISLLLAYHKRISKILGFDILTCLFVAFIVLGIVAMAIAYG